jgi:hypothetical protein
MGLRHLSHPTIAAWLPPYQASVAWARYRVPSRLKSGASIL